MIKWCMGSTLLMDMHPDPVSDAAHRFGKTEFINSVDLKEQAQEALVPE